MIHSGSYQQFNLKNRTALVCGASQGIGEAIARHLASLEARVILLARSEGKLKEICQSLPGKGHSIIAVDLAVRAEVEAKITEKLSEGPIHIVVNNTGGPKSGLLIEAKEEDFLDGFKNHILVAQLLARLLSPGMKSADYGRIINIISTSVKVPIPFLGVSNTIRAAMANWAKSMANELGASHITVNNILPGFTTTPRLDSLRKATAEKQKLTEAQVDLNWKASIPLGRFAEPAEIAYAVSFLASPLAGYISGINLPVDGGRTPTL